MTMMKIIHYLYNWLIKASASPHAMQILFVVAFVESSFFPIPPDIMIIPMALAMPTKAWRIAAVATVASVLGGYFGYYIGLLGYDTVAKPILAFYGYADKFEVFKTYYHQWGAWIVFMAGLTPFPYKVITIASGAVGLNIWVFGAASVAARGMRFFFIAWLLKKYGAPIKTFIDKNLGILSILFVVILVGGFALLKYI